MPIVSANDIDFYCEFTGPADAPVVVFINALGATVEMWREQVEALSAGYRCLTFDANGHGRSSAQAMRPAIQSLANDLAGLLGALAVSRATIVGASIGGMIAQCLAAKYPEQVDRLVLIATTPKMPDARPWTERAANVRREGLETIAGAAMTRWFMADFAAARPDRVEETRRLFLETDRESYALCCEAIAAMDLTEIIADIAAPTLVMAAAMDLSTPLETAEKLRRTISGAAMLIVPDAAHMLVIERAAEASSWISAFLDLPKR